MFRLKKSSRFTPLPYNKYSFGSGGVLQERSCCFLYCPTICRFFVWKVHSPASFFYTLYSILLQTQTEIFSHPHRFPLWKVIVLIHMPKKLYLWKSIIISLLYSLILKSIFFEGFICLQTKNATTAPNRLYNISVLK